jgi:hypothetical protein
MPCKVVCSTSERYYHLLPVFAYLFNKYFDKDQPVEVVGYSIPNWELPANFTFRSLGKQGDVSEWSTDLRKYFESIPDKEILWCMEDSFFKRVDLTAVKIAHSSVSIGHRVGRFDLTNDVQKRPHTIRGSVVVADQDTNYRLSTQASIWNKRFLLQYLTPGQSPWIFEKQEAKNDGWEILGLVEPAAKVNEGVRKWDPHELDLNGFPEEDVLFIKTLL